MSDCIFCSIIAGEIPCFKVYEDENLLAILDRFPSAPGHTLILPKRHAADIYALNDTEAAAIIPLAQRLAAKIKSELAPEGLNILQNNGKAAGQDIFHYHLHLIPRSLGGHFKISHAPTDPPLSELEEMAERLKL